MEKKIMSKSTATSPPSPSPSPSPSDSAATTSTTPPISSSSSPLPSPPTALPTPEAIEVLLSPDGYYRYLGIPIPEFDAHGPRYKEAMAVGGGGAGDAVPAIDLDRVKRNYRRLSLRHHPDRRTGDAEAFRMLNRAKVVLSNPRLRREYDLVGLDLEDDNADDNVVDGRHHHHRHHRDGGGDADDDDDGGGGVGGRRREDADIGGGNDGRDDNDNGGGGGGKADGSGGGGKTETVMGHLASATLAAILQVVVRTGLMGIISVLISRYTILTLPAMGALLYISYKLYSTLRATVGLKNLTVAVMKDALSPLLIALGIFCMYRGRRFAILTATSGVDVIVDNSIVGGDGGDAVARAATTAAATAYLDWSWTFWFGEALVMLLFVSNSFDRQGRALMIAFAVVSLLFTLWLRGRFWRYAIVLVLEGVVAMACLVVFPIMEMILESIVEEKMRKVGEKIRAHDRRMRELSMKKKRETSGSSSFG
ncbi:hypothetical protein ACHAXA_000035 [Cyclostephanos tholiformis]|uniref:J domain-containing protein n=1 Tax=Cyclostephanos tholiformis TaxID=382380 RepID=A0ABD3SQT7_9STRA